jgi:hypothetical protein
MNKIFLYLFFGVSISGFSQALNPTHTYKEFGWTITIPSEFEAVNEAEWATIEDRGVKAIEETHGEQLIDQTTTLFAYRNNQFNVFESNNQPFDENVDGNWVASCKEVNDIVFQTFQAQMPNIPIDSTSSVETIAGRKFQTFMIKASLPNGIQLKSLMFSSLFPNLKKELTVSITSVDDVQFEKMLRAFRTSRFK